MLRAFSRGTVRNPTWLSQLRVNKSTKAQSEDAESSLPGTVNDPQNSSLAGGVTAHSPTQLSAHFSSPLVEPAPTFRIVQSSRGYPTGRPWRPLPVPIIHHQVFKHGRATLLSHNDEDAFEDLNLTILFDKEKSLQQGVDRVNWRRDLLRILGNTQSHSQGWKAYETLVSVPFPIPYPHLNRLVRLISLQRPKTQTLFSRLLHVLTIIHQSGRKLTTYQWNALIDNAGKGLRNARPADFQNAFNAFVDFVSARQPGTAILPNEADFDPGASSNILPDIRTYTTLINHAVERRDKVALEQTTSLLKASGMSPNRVSHLVLLKYYTKNGKLRDIRTVLERMSREGQELGLDGVNACLWAFSCHNRFDMVMKIYRLLRNNMVPETALGPNDIDSVSRSLADQHITIRSTMIPNKVTFTLTAQAAAYHGHLREALQAFTDMLSSENVEIGAPLYRVEDGNIVPSPYEPDLAMFRALFLGFYRHGVPSAPDHPGQHPWVLPVLNDMLDVFLALPKHIEPSRSTIYWLLVAFEKTSNQDMELLKTVWGRIRSHFREEWVNSRNIDQVQSRFFESKLP
ncbi:hypothetical protein MIND_00718200 [Mycena indigotica]|uniref:Pentatricopeptide repeat protein n=1 Tax=Mycena indigotica TaxID=2126181 RepID=A0A8H6SNK3_9AGAR|nr:uncharacterized protein MIND_00718200 [Mycena indigotica]KAF7301527.1 hypothetical protein MIND_00718200 [Mycena indigotica]